MPIRINLLAEAQAAEEARLNDPVKRGIWIGGFLVFVFVLYIGKLYTDIVVSNMRYGKQEARWSGPNGLLAKSSAVTNYQAKIAVAEKRIGQLNRISTNRFYWGTLLNVLQQTVVDDVQLTSFKGVQDYTLTPATPPRKVDDKFVPGVPASATEKISLTLEGRDWNYMQQNYERYRQSLSAHDYFSRLSDKRGFRLSDTLGTAVTDPATARTYLTFILESRFAEVVRRE